MRKHPASKIYIYIYIYDNIIIKKDFKQVI